MRSLKTQNTDELFHPLQLDTIKNKGYHPYLESWNVAKKISEFLSVHCC